MVYSQLYVLFFFFRSCVQHPVFIFFAGCAISWNIVRCASDHAANCVETSFQLTVVMRWGTSSFKCAHRKIWLPFCTLTEVKDNCAHKVLKPSQLAHQPRENTKGRRQMSENRQGYLQGVLRKTATQSYAKYEYVKYETGFAIKKSIVCCSLG